MTKGVLDTRLLGPADWRLLRETRLRALRDSPNAFISRYSRERSLNDDHWRRRIRTASWVVAREHGDVIGIAGLVGGCPEEPEHLESIWVAPPHRKRGVFRSLLARVTEIARAAELSELCVWVLEDNPLASHVHARAGFVWTGERKLINPGDGRFERRMRLVIRSPSAWITGPAPR